MEGNGKYKTELADKNIFSLAELSETSFPFPSISTFLNIYKINGV
jgi:hypothetical protein